jgi:hypothetical protein
MSQGEGASFTSRRLRRTSGLFASAPWSNEVELYLPLRTGSAATQTVSVVKLAQSVDGTVVDVATCF